MTTCIARFARHQARIRLFGVVDWRPGIALLLALMVSACGGGGDGFDSSMPAAASASGAAAGAEQVATALSPARQAMSAEELIDNFESGMDKWSNWGNAQVVDGAGVAGSRAMRVGTGAGGAGYNVWEVMAGSTYRITAQARVSDASEILFIGINIVTPEGVVVAKQMASISSTTYSLVSMEVKVPDSGAYGADVFVWKNAGSGYGFVDNVTFSQVDVTAPPPPPPPPPSTNLMSNPGFQAGMTSWVNWANAVVVDGAGISASRALRVGTAAGGAAQDVAGIVPGAEYQLTVQARMSVPGEVSYIGLNMLDASGNVVAQRLTEVRDTTFQTVSAQLTAPANAVKAVVYVWKNASSGYVFVDDVVLTIAAATPPPPPPPLPSGFYNLLSNPGFEAGMSSWVDWGNTIVLAGAGASGSNALRVGTSAGGAGQDAGSVVPGVQYRLTARARVSDSSETGYIGVNLIDAGGANISQQVITFSNTTYATLASAEFQAPPGAVRAFVFVWKNSGGGFIYVDEIEFGRAAETTPNLVVNGGFEGKLANWNTNAHGATVVTDAASGAYAVAVGPGEFVAQDVTLVPGRTYRFSAQIKVSGTIPNDPLMGPIGVFVFIYDDPTESVGFFALPSPPSGGTYQVASLEFTVPSPATGFRVYVANNPNANGLYIYADNISLLPL